MGGVRQRRKALPGAGRVKSCSERGQWGDAEAARGLGEPGSRARERAGERVGGFWAISPGIPLPDGWEAASGERGRGGTLRRGLGTG